MASNKIHADSRCKINLPTPLQKPEVVSYDSPIALFQLDEWL